MTPKRRLSILHAGDTSQNLRVANERWHNISLSLKGQRLIFCDLHSGQILWIPELLFTCHNDWS